MLCDATNRILGIARALPVAHLSMPMPIQPLEPTATFAQSWDFPLAQRKAVAAYACQFAKPFWGASFTFQGDTRSAKLPSFAGSVVITETLRTQTRTRNDYTMTGLANIDHYHGSFVLKANGPNQVRLTWQIELAFQNAEALVIVAQLFAAVSSSMTDALQKAFGLP